MSKSKSIPIIESNVFEGHESKNFAAGIVAIGSHAVDGYVNEFEGAAELRAATYLDKGFIEYKDLDNAGTELDSDDERSVHFVVLERHDVAKALARVVGNMRLIVKSVDNPDQLPVEKFYQDQFGKNGVPTGATEVSRLICRHEDSVIQNTLKWPLFIGGVKHVIAEKLGPVYGLLEPDLANALMIQRVPVKPLADARFIPEINATKQPIEVNIPALKNVIDLVGDQGVDPRNGFSYLSIGSDEYRNTKQAV